MTELDLKNSVRRAVKKLYPDAFFWKIHDGFTNGIPDLEIIIQGVHIFIELKTPRGDIEPIQEYTISKINASGGHAYICRSKEEVMEVIKQCLEKHGF